MLATRLFAIGLLAVTLGATSPASAGVRMYKGEWIADSFGNDKAQAFTQPTPTGDTESLYFAVFPVPVGRQCNQAYPICQFASTPVSTPGGSFAVLGPACTPYTKFPHPTTGGKGVRPTARGQTFTVGGGYVATQSMGVNNRVPPLYRNKAFFSAGGQPNHTACDGSHTVRGKAAAAYAHPFAEPYGLMPNRGELALGAPVSGTGSATTTTAMKGFTIPGAPVTGPGGMRRTTLGEFSYDAFPYLYSYTYRTLRNDKGGFAVGGGFFGGAGGTYVLPYKQGANTVAKAVVKAGANRFGGTMKLLGNSLGKVCYFLQGGCSLGGWDWRYKSIGGYTTTYQYKAWSKPAKYQLITQTTKYYNTNGMGTSVVLLSAWRFPWTTGNVTVTATGRGPNNTIEQRKGYDKRMKALTDMGSASAHYGPIQLVSPVLTRWLQPAANFETGGVGIVRFRFMPEPHKWMMLVGGLSLLGVLYRFRGR